MTAKPVLRHHGLRIIDSTHAELRFGIVELIERRQSLAWIGEPGLSPGQQQVLKRFHNREYWQCCAKLRDTAFKLLDALRQLSGALLVMEQRDQYAYDGAPMEHAAAFFSACREAPYHLDSYISYLRILVDCVGFALPFFYVTKKSISNRSFRDHRAWFLANPDFDPAYRVILESHTSWFELLAGKDGHNSGSQGIRDLNFHRFATYQFGSRQRLDGKHQILISHITGKGIEGQDLLATLEDLTHGLFAYLELVRDHFAEHARREFPQHDWSSEARSVLTMLEAQDTQAKYRLIPGMT